MWCGGVCALARVLNMQLTRQNCFSVFQKKVIFLPCDDLTGFVCHLFRWRRVFEVKRLAFAGSNSMVSPNMVPVRSGRSSALRYEELFVVLGFKPATRDCDEPRQILRHLGCPDQNDTSTPAPAAWSDPKYS